MISTHHCMMSRPTSVYRTAVPSHSLYFNAPVSSPLDFFANPSFLHSSVHASSTFQQYHSAVSSFLACVRMKSSSICCMSHAQLDELLCAYIHHCYAHGKQRTHVQHVLYALCYFFPHFHAKSLCAAMKCIAGWNRLTPSQSFQPMPITLVYVAACTCLFAPSSLFPTRLYHPYLRLHVCIGILLSFDCYLRISELYNLRIGDVTVPRTYTLGAHPYQRTCIHLRKTKTSNNLSVVIHNPIIAYYLHRIIIGRDKNEFVFPWFGFEGYRYRQVFTAIVSAWNLPPPLTFVPHSLRHGGATHDYVINNCSIEYIQQRGRWASHNSVLRYIQTRRAVDQSNTIPITFIRLGGVLQPSLYALLEAFITNKSHAYGCAIVPDDYFVM